MLNKFFRFSILFTVLFGLSTLVHAQAILAVSEGTSGGLDSAQVVSKYQAIADILGKAANEKINIILVRDFASLEEGMKEGRFKYVIARPSDYPARGIRDYRYQYIASAKPDGQCFFVVDKSSPLQRLSDSKGKRFLLAEPAAYMAKLCRAELRDNGIVIEKENVQRIKDQQATGFYLKNSFADVAGIASYSAIAKKWEKEGNRIIHKSVPQPYNPLIAQKSLPPEAVLRIRTALSNLNQTDTGKAVLSSLSFDSFEFDPQGELRLLRLLTWLEK